MSAHLEMQPVPPVEVDPRLPAALNEIILMSIVKDPAKRFQSAAAFGAAIASVGGRVPSAAAARPTQTMAAAAAPSARAAAPPSSGSSRRGLYMALGAVVLVLAVVAGAIGIPKLLRTQAGESPAPAQQEALPPASAEQQPATSQPVPTEPAPIPVSTPVASQPAAAKTGAGPAQPPSRTQSQPSAQPQNRQQSQGQQYAQPQGQAPAVQQPAVAQPAAQAPAADLAKAAALRETQKAWPMLASRAGAISSTLQNLQNEQKRSGLGLRGDISASWKRMEYYMDQAEAAISAKDPAMAKEHMDSAEREIQTLEKFLGR
jgi:serine/threonine-protein kinase